MLALAGQPGPLAVAMAAPALMMLALLGRIGWSSSVMEWMRRCLLFGFAAVFQIWRDGAILMRWRNQGHGQESSYTWREMIRNWWLPVTGSFLFLALFLTANPILSLWGAIWRQRILDCFGDLDVTAGRLSFWLVTASATWALLRTRTSAMTRTETRDRFSGRRPGPVLLVRCLILFNLAFAVQTILEIAYLWGGKALPSGMTYAEYAHRGASLQRKRIPEMMIFSAGDEKIDRDVRSEN